MSPYQIEDQKNEQISKLEVLQERAGSPNTSVFKEAAQQAVDEFTADWTEEQLRALLATAIRYIRPLK